MWYEIEKKDSKVGDETKQSELRLKLRGRVNSSDGAVVNEWGKRIINEQKD